MRELADEDRSLDSSSREDQILGVRTALLQIDLKMTLNVSILRQRPKESTK